MKQIDFTNYKFRCSAIGKLMTSPRNKSETLSETTKTYLKDLWIKEVYGRERDFTTKEMEKGTRQEEVALTMVTDYFEQTTGKKGILIKNKRQLENEWITGTPDLTVPFVGDIKVSWDLHTFPMFETECPEDNYYWQLAVGYAWLMGLKDGQTVKLIYVLPDAPEYQIVKAKKFSPLYDMNPDSEEYMELEQKIEDGLTFGDIPLKEKVKIFEIPVNEADRGLLKTRIEESRKYLQELHNIRG